MLQFWGGGGQLSSLIAGRLEHQPASKTASTSGLGIHVLSRPGSAPGADLRWRVPFKPGRAPQGRLQTYAPGVRKSLKPKLQKAGNHSTLPPPLWSGLLRPPLFSTTLKSFLSNLLSLRNCEKAVDTPWKPPYGQFSACLGVAKDS